MKAIVLALAALLGATAGAGGMLAVQDPNPVVFPPTTAAPQVTRLPDTTTAVTPTRLLLAWTPGGLPPGLDTAATGVPGVAAVAVVRGDPVDLARTVAADGGVIDQPPAGWSIPLDAAAVDPATFTQVVPAGDRAAVGGLGPGEALLGETSARIRRLGPGGRLELRHGGAVVVAAVVPDETVGGAELVVDVATGEGLGITTARALIVAHAGDRAAVEAALAGALPAGTPVRFRAPGETPYLRAGDAVLPQVVLKDVFGEFAYRAGPGGDRGVEIDPAWVAANVAEADLPIVGRVRCHRSVLVALEGAMAELAAEGLAGVVAPGGFDGCWVPRLIRPGTPLSHHSWGVALDLNYRLNPTNVASGQDSRLVEVLERWGFGWGGRWLIPDPAHFEYLAPPTST